MISRLAIFLSFFSTVIVTAQTLKGKVVDAKTNAPLEMVSVYFDNTTVGTVTNEHGEFSIDYNDAIQSTLVISILGYQKAYINDYREKMDILVALTEALNALDEVEISYDDGLTRKQKLKLFKENFLGTSKIAKSCEILNEDAIFLKYDKDEKKLFASSKNSLIISNDALGYNITYDIVDFEIVFGYVNPDRNQFNIKQVSYYGTMFFEEKDDGKRQRWRQKNREKAYEGSVQQLMRALYYKDFKEKGFVFSEGSFKISPYKYLSLSDADSTGLVTAKLSKKIGVHYGNQSSFMQPLTDEFKIDRYGNYQPIKSVFFGGDIGKQRVGDTLPLDYGLDSYNQTTEDDFTVVGTWSVVDVVEHPKEPPFSLMTDSFKTATFVFNSDKTTHLKTKVNTNFFSITSSIINESIWNLNDVNGTQSIQIIGKDKTLKMEIFITKKGKAILFGIGKATEPSYFLLKVEKQ